MTTERLSGLSLLHIHRDIPVDVPRDNIISDVPEAIDEFARRHPRRLQLVDILADWTDQIHVPHYDMYAPAQY